MSDVEPGKLPGEPGTKEGEAGPSESDPEVPSLEDRDVAGNGGAEGGDNG